jgi:hypothetical protein
MAAFWRAQCTRVGAGMRSCLSLLRTFRG